MNCFDFIHLRIFSSVHSVDFSSWSVWYRDFAMMIFLSFKTHTSRRCKTSLILLNELFDTFVSDLKSFSIQSLKSSQDCSYRLVFLKFAFSHFFIIIFIKAFLSSCVISLILMFIVELRSAKWESMKRFDSRVKVIVI
jgi:hypothetical protein